MIQDIAPHRLDNHFVPGKEPAADSPVYVFRGNLLLAKADAENDIVLPRYSDLQGAVQYLFTMDETDCFLSEDAGNAVAEENPAPAGASFVFRDLTTFRRSGQYPRWKVFAAITAYQLANWYRDNRFCGTCGTPTVHGPEDRSIRCPSCGRVIYPRIVPAVIVGVTNGDKLLMTKYAARPNVPYYALVAGFTEIGETLEQTVQREVMEETGLRVTNIRYYKSQPWGIVDDILSGFFCDVAGDDNIVMDAQELKTAEWVDRDKIELQPNDYSLTNEMMMVFRSGRETRYGKTRDDAVQ